MSTFSYRAINTQGKIQQGEISADDESRAQDLLKDQGLTIISIESGRRKPFSPNLFQARSQQLRPKETLLFTRQMQSFCDADIPVKQAIQAIIKHSTVENLKACCQSISQGLDEGHSLSHALSLCGGGFDDLYLAQIKAGEKSGKLSEVLESLAQHLEEQQSQNHKIRMASLYPTILCAVALFIITLLLSTVLPKLIQQLQGQEDLPLLTNIMITLSEWIREYGFYVLLLMLAIALVKHFFYPHSRWRLAIAEHIPALRKLMQLRDASRYLATLSVLYKAGIPLAEAAKSSAEVIRGKKLRTLLAQAEEQLQAGKRLSELLQQSQLFSPNSLLLISNGEHNGRLADMLDKAAREERSELNQGIDLSLAVLEPLLITVVGGFVFIIVLAILLPLMQINSLVA
ncbi:type II secretion system F family protein [Pseudoteredinibacter isoporae]|uniref:type II secretion system F family protein n=1 Tax=Pseudoteredinibacter isoporae TaxID=570281 RepID=UPI0031068B39